jgi:prepilin-type N-terminal cleavage/methylation domain-containing protein
MMSRSYPLAELSVGGWPSSVRRRSGRGGFSLVELMVAVLIMAIMMGLLAPAVQGLLGVTGPRGGMNTVSAALEQARLSAMESGVPTYLGWAPETANSPSSSVIVFRERREGEAAPFTAVTRWMRLPQGVFMESLGGAAAVPAGANLPRLDDQALSLVPAIKFDRFGRLAQATEPSVLRVGAKSRTGEAFTGGEDQYFQLDVQPLTGRVIVADRAMEGVR